MSINFANPEFLFFLLALPLLVVTHFYLLRFTKKKAMLFSNTETLRRVQKNHSVSKTLGSLTIRLLTLTCVVLAAAAPTLLYEADAQTSDFVLVVDASASMTAQDLEPTRFEAAKEAAATFVDEFSDAARFGVVSYAGYPTIHQPLDPDRTTTAQTIRAIQMQSISGTDPASAVITATNLLISSERGRVAIIFSDGLNTAFLAEENPLLRATRYAQENRVTIHAVGIGEAGTTPVGYLPSIYNVSASYHPENLRFLTQQTGGRFLEAPNQETLQEQLQELLEDPYSRQESLPLTTGLLFAALLLLFLEWGLANTRYRLIP